MLHFESYIYITIQRNLCIPAAVTVSTESELLLDIHKGISAKVDHGRTPIPLIR